MQISRHRPVLQACDRCRVLTTMHDPLTGFFRLPFFLDQVTHHLVGGSARRTPMSLILFDIDRFRTYSLFLGTSTSDLLLAQIADLLIAQHPVAVTRIMADRFAVLVPQNDEMELLATVRSRLSRPLSLSNTSVQPTLSAGIAHLPTPSADDALRDAEMALAAAKADGKGQVRVCTADMRRHNRERARVETLLPRAIENRELYLAYQPIVCMENRKVAGYEALMRWRSPEMGEISPRVFIPVAEETSMIVEIGELALRDALTTLARLPSPLFVSVNIAPRQMADKAHMMRLIKMLEDVPPEIRRRLSLEVTESTMLADPVVSAGLLANFRDLGCSVSLDDFGTGYSSLAMLHRIQFDTIKLDRAFVSGLHCREIAQPQIVSTVASLASVLGANLVAEGIESEEQASHLAGLRVHYGQGWLFGRPEPLPTS